jgi:hypothetical protein
MTCQGDSARTLLKSGWKIRSSPYVFGDVHGGVSRIVFDWPGSGLVCLNKLSVGGSGFSNFLADLGNAEATASLRHRSSMAELVSIEMTGLAGRPRMDGVTGHPQWSNSSPQTTSGCVSRRPPCRIQVLDDAVACTF